MKRHFGFLCLALAFGVLPMLRAENWGGQQAPAQPASAPSQPAAGAPAQQPAQPPAAQPEEGAPLSKLGLSEDQKKQIHRIRKNSQQQVQAVKSDSSLTPEQQAQQTRQIRRKANQQVESVLTPEQRERYEAWRREHQRRRQPSQTKPTGA
jgi:periplasmic protein CpxP/Spy